MSQKNSIGLIAERDPEDGHDYMAELHSSPHQRRMIAEVDLAYDTSLVMDGLEAFITGVEPNYKEIEKALDLIS
jgi:hypothetical protein